MQQLRLLRSSRDLRQSDVAKAMGIDRTTYAKYESGASEPNNEMLHKLADFYDVPADFLTGSGVFNCWFLVVLCSTQVAEAMIHAVPEKHREAAKRDIDFFIGLIKENEVISALGESSARWFQFAVKWISIDAHPMPSGGVHADVELALTDEYLRLFENNSIKTPPVSNLDTSGIEGTPEEIREMLQALAAASPETQEIISLLIKLNPENQARALEYIRFELDRQGDGAERA